jgi:hypothetical protein
MSKFNLERKTARLIVLQRIELISPLLKKLRKFFGRYIFSSFITKYFLNIKIIEKNYHNLMSFEFNLLKKYLDFENKKILSIGGGVGGLELLIGREFNSSFYFIEKNYITKKVRYGWDHLNKEAYNDLNLLNNFLISNNLSPNRFKIFDYDKNKLPEEKFDIIISLYSLDYHYNFNIYFDYLKKVSNENTIIVFDTIKPELFNSIFTKVTVIKEDLNTVHKSKRIMCRGFI